MLSRGSSGVFLAMHIAAGKEGLIMRVTHLGAMALAAGVISGCSGSGDAYQASVIGSFEATPAAQAAGVVEATDESFIHDISTAGNKEIELAHLAEMKTTKPRVKEFAQMMIRDHQQADADLKRTAQQLNVTPTVANDAIEQAMNQLSGLNGVAFDRAYMEMMFLDHQKALSLIQDKAANARAQALREWANRTLPTIRRHLEQAQLVQRSL